MCSQHYKFVVHHVEKFIKKTRPQTRLLAVYAIDAICRHAKAKFGEKSPYESRFAKKMEANFATLVECPEGDLVSALTSDSIHNLKRSLLAGTNSPCCRRLDSETNVSRRRDDRDSIDDSRQVAERLWLG